MRNILSIDYYDPNELTVAPTNNRKILPSEIKFQEMLASVKATGGIEEPLIINSKKQIVSGQLRWLASKRLGLDKIPAIIVHFDSEMDERIVSMIQDYVRTDLEDIDKGKFVTDAVESGISIDKLSELTGIASSNLYLWAKASKIPKAIESDPSLVEDFLKAETKQRTLMHTALNAPEVEKHVNIADLIHAGKDLTASQLGNIVKDLHQGLNVDPKKTLEMINSETKHMLIAYECAQPLYDVIITIAKMVNKDIHGTMTMMLTEDAEHRGIRVTL